MSSAGPSRRNDGRQPNQLRLIHISVGELDRADGSGRFAFGSEAALASFTGPIEVRLREEIPTKATVEITHRPLEGIGATPSRALITTLEHVFPPILSLHQHPRSLLQLVVQSLSPSSSSSTTTSSSSSSWYIDTTPDQGKIQNTWPPNDDITPDDEYELSKLEKQKQNALAPMTGSSFSSRASAINASTLAILDAGSIASTAVPIAISIVDLGGGGNKLVVDPTVEEEGNAKSRFGFAWAYGAGISLAKSNLDGEGGMEIDDEEKEKEAELVWVESEGDFTRREFSDALELSKIACTQILEQIRIELGKHLEQRRLA